MDTQPQPGTALRADPSHPFPATAYTANPSARDSSFSSFVNCLFSSALASNTEASKQIPRLSSYLSLHFLICEMGRPQLTTTKATELMSTKLGTKVPERT